ncbi:MAG: GxxExxY protein [Ignavibacteria bacterium]
MNIDDKLTEKIIGCAFTVHKKLGSGFLEKVYENALAIELKNNGLKAEQQYPIPVKYDEYLVGDYYADILVENEIVVEIKAVENLNKKHEAQVVNYLNGTGLDIGLLINFGESVEIKRKYRIYKPKK